MDIAEKYAQQTGGDLSEVKDRWDGRPDRVIEDIFRVRDPDTSEVEDLELFPYQKKAVMAYFYGDSSTIVVYKGRRIGMTRVFEWCMMLDGLRTGNLTFPIVCQSGEDSKKRIADLEEVLEDCRLPIDPSDDDVKNIATKLILPNGTRFESFTAGSDSGRGDDPARAVLMDEMAFFPEQEDTVAAFGASTLLGEKSTEIRVSTPKTTGDLFMQSFENGSRTGYTDKEGQEVSPDHPEARPVPISIKQPTVANPEAVDIDQSLFDQDIEPVRKGVNIQKLEEDRMSDPQKFAQEYLCRPISDEYRFFSADAVERAMNRSEDRNFRAGVDFRSDNDIILAADVAFGGGDDTVVTVFERVNDRSRNMRHLEVIDRESLREAGIREPNLSNPDHQARRIAEIAKSVDADHIIYDETGNQFFEEALRKYTGRGLHGFNFTDQDAVNEMAQNLNHGLHNDDVTLLKDRRLRDQLLSIVKEQDKDWQHPKYTGKEQSPTGKDDMAIATILGAYPAMLDRGGKRLREVDDDIPPNNQRERAEQQEQANRTMRRVNPSSRTPAAVYGTTSPNRDRRYRSRHDDHSRR